MKQNLFQSHIGRRAAALLLTLCMLLPLMPAVAFAEGEVEYIYLDLALGSITFSASNYTYYVRENNQNVKKTGTHTASNRYYIYQSSGAYETAPVENYVDIPDELLINETNIAKVKTNWQTYATTAQDGKKVRTATKNSITVKGNSTFDIVLDNIWTNCEASGQSRTTAGIMIPTTGSTNVTLRLKGDNRVGNIYYPSTSTNNSLKITSFEGDGATSGTLTAANYTDGAAYWTSAIGGNDSTSTESAIGIHIAGGTVYAGTTVKDNCTAIGGGGNGTGTIEISGGIVTAVSFSTGTAIGGGIGFSSRGGEGNVTITGGEIYAYNFGIGYSNTFVPGTAIGGGSSYSLDAKASTVKITGGTVYAESLGGSAIGAGNSVKQQGGNATVSISGGSITAKSVSGTSAQGYSVSEGTAIGGGNSTQAWGGDATVTISGGTINSGPIGGGSGQGLNKTTATKGDGGKATVTVSGGRITAGSIGGGDSKHANGGDATVTVNGGTIKANGVGGGFSETHGYATGTVTINGGSVNTEIAAIPKNQNGDLLFLTRINVYLDNMLLPNAPINTFEGAGIDQFKIDGVYTDDVGVLYFWLPDNSAITAATFNEKPEEKYECKEADGKIDVKDVGALEYNTPKDLCLLNVTNSGFYQLYYDAECTQPFNGTVVVTRGEVFSYAVKVAEESAGVYYQLHSYYAMTDAGGNKIMQPANILSEKETHTVSMTITQDTQVWYSIVDSQGNKVFALDLTNGNITVSKGDQGLIIDQNGYKISNFKGSLYLTSSGYPTSNTVTVDCGTETVNMVINEINVCSNDSVINIESGTLELSFGEADNMIRSTHTAAVSVADGARLHINFEGKESVKIDGANATPAIQGEGHVTVNDEGGFLKLNSSQTISSTEQILVGSYDYNGNRQTIQASLSNGTYKYELIGYVRPDDAEDLKLHDKDDIINNTTTESFSARGILVTPNKVDIISKTLINGDFVMLMQTNNGGNFGQIVVKNGDGKILTEGTDYKVDRSEDKPTLSRGTDANKVYATLTIYGSTYKKEENRNLLVMAAAEGVINYTAESYEKTYDGKSYTFAVDVDTTYFEVWYGKEEITAENFTTVEKQLVPYQFTNVTDSGTVYWFIKLKDAYNGNLNDIKYNPVNGNNTVTITKASNKWIEKLTCPSIVIIKSGDTTNPTPSAKAAFGDVNYTYYQEGAEGKEQLAENAEKQLAVGTYFVIATVVKTDNYAGLTSDYISFTVTLTKVFVSNSHALDKLTQTADKINTPTNGAFSVYFSAKYEENMELRFSEFTNGVTSIGKAKITMIVFEATGQKYYYYNLLAGQTNIALSEFVKMGSLSDKYQPPEPGTTVEYQFCVDLAEDNDVITTFSVLLIDKNNETSNYQTGAAELIMRTAAYFQELSGDSKIITDVVGDTISVKLKPYANGAYNKILAVIVKAVNDQSGEKQVNLMLNSSSEDTAEKAINLQLAQGNLFIFSLGDSSAQVNGEHTLTIGNLTPGEYEIKCFIRLVEDGLDPRYALTSNDSEDIVFTSGANTTITVNEPTLFVSLASGQDRVITKDTKSLTFNVQHSGCDNGTRCLLNATLYKKVNGNYVSLIALPTHTLTKHNDTESMEVDLSNVAQRMSVGTYRIVFELHGVTYNYNLIVTESTS